MKLVQCCMCCTSGDYKVLLDMEEEMIKALEEKVIGDGLRTPHREQLLFGMLADNENLSRNEQIQAKNQLLGAFSAVGKRFLAQIRGFKPRVRERWGTLSLLILCTLTDQKERMKYGDCFLL